MSAPGFPAGFNLAQWLQSIGMGQYEESFKANEVTAELLPHLNDEILEHMGVAMPVHRKILLHAIAKLAPQPPPVVPSPPPPPAPAAPSAVPPLQEKSRGYVPPDIYASPAEPAPATAETTAGPDRKSKSRKMWARLLASKFLLVSIIAHLVFGAVATFWIVQRVQANRKLTFQGGAPTTNPSKRALEHKVSMAKKKTGGAPPQARRIVSAGLAKISLPEMPSLPASSTSVTGMMAGMGGAGMGQGMGFGNGMGSGMGGGGGGGGGLTMFGFHNSSGGGLAGEFYDLKQTRDRRPSGVGHAQYGNIIRDFIKSGWNEGMLQNYYRSAKILYAPQIWVPEIKADLAPKAFDVDKEVQPQRWLALYKGKVTAPESGTFHFVGDGDDILFVRFDNRTVLNGSWIDLRLGQIGGEEEDRRLGLKSAGRYQYHWPPPPNGELFTKGEGFTVQAGQTYPIEILIGEWPGGYSHFVLLIEKEGSAYPSAPGGSAPILPVFRMAHVGTIDSGEHGSMPPHSDFGKIWRAVSAAPAPGSGSLLDALRK